MNKKKHACLTLQVGVTLAVLKSSHFIQSCRGCGLRIAVCTAAGRSSSDDSDDSDISDDDQEEDDEDDEDDAAAQNEGKRPREQIAQGRWVLRRALPVATTATLRLFQWGGKVDLVIYLVHHSSPPVESTKFWGGTCSRTRRNSGKMAMEPSLLPSPDQHEVHQARSAMS